MRKKCNNKESVIPLVQKSLKINTSAKKIKNMIVTKKSIHLSRTIRLHMKLIMTTIRRPIYYTKNDNEDDINKISIDLTSRELFVFFLIIFAYSIYNN